MADISVAENLVDASDNVSASFMVSDDLLAAHELSYSFTSSNQALLPDASISTRFSGNTVYVDMDPIDDANGHSTITVFVDDDVNFITDSFDLYISPENDLPEFISIPPSISVEEDGTTSIFIEVDDVDGDALSLYSSASKGYLNEIGDGSFSYVPFANLNGTDVITVSLTDAFETVTQDINVTINPVNDAPTGNPIITGGNQVGDTLSVDLNQIQDVDGLPGSFSYQWYRDGTAVAGATSQNYTTTANDVGRSLSVVLSYTDLDGTFEIIGSDAFELSSHPATEFEILFNTPQDLNIADTR